MVSLLLVAIAAIMNAAMDTINHHWYRSIFTRWALPFWASLDESWKNKYINGDPLDGRKKWDLWLFKVNIHPAFLDGWHMSKSIMVVLLCGAIVFYTKIVNIWVDIIILGSVWNLVFSLFYNKLLLRKGYR